MNRKIVHPLYPAEYQHPFDFESLRRLKRTPGLELLTQKLLDFGLEKYLRIKHTGDHLRMNPAKVPELFGVLLEACKILGHRQIPDLYLWQEDKIKSFTSGQKKPIIVISRGAVESLSREELLFIFGRELGHIRSAHLFYRMMAESIRTIAQLINDVSLGLGNLLSMPIQMALMHWYRMSEFSADRAGLLCCQDIEVVAKCFLKMAGLPESMEGKITVQDLRQQAKEFDDLQETQFDKFIRFAAAHENPHPFIVIRASELFRWAGRGEYQEIMDKKSGQEISAELRCPECQSPGSKNDLFCSYCGAEIRTSTAPEEIPSESSPLPPTKSSD